MTDPSDAHQSSAEPVVPDEVQPGLGGLDLGELMGMAQNLQEQMRLDAQRISTTMVEGTAGGGSVTVSVSGAYEFDSVTIRPEVIDPTDPEMLCDLVLAALRDAAQKVGRLHAEADPLGGALGGMGGGAGGLGTLFGN
ncbi:MAG: YbaB/EbfC family nucleoid-associated protein [Microthrixaceae bacterium]